jgi:hypothetical protein
MRKIGIYFVAVIFALAMTVSNPQPAKAGGAVALAVVAALLTVATVKCANAGEKGGDRLCFFDIFAPRGTITVTKTPKKGKEAHNARSRLAYASTELSALSAH